jgi:phage repressor protein C with HTH and peptisase S24 domain
MCVRFGTCQIMSRANAKLPRHGACCQMPSMTLSSFSQRLLAILEARGLSKRQVADLAGVKYHALNAVLIRDNAVPNAVLAQQIADGLRIPIEHLTRGDPLVARSTVAIAGKVGAGARVPLIDVFEKGDGPQVECPAGLSPHGIVAVEVEGDSMEPVYSDGDLLFYTREALGVPDEALGHRCVCEDADGHAWVKQVKPGREPGTFDLISLNRGVDPMWGVRLKWAARVRLHWPAELAVRGE